MPQMLSGGFFDLLCQVVNTGEPLLGEVEILDPQVRATWLRYQVVRLGDGIAMTLGNISDMKASRTALQGAGRVYGVDL